MQHKTSCTDLSQVTVKIHKRQCSIVHMKIKPKITTSKQLISVYLLSLATLAIILAVSIQTSDGAAFNPVGKYKSSQDRGCYYMLQHFKNGEQIKTDEPCLNCTCENSMLMCYLRVCPYVKPVGDRCLIERIPGECCPKITCTDFAPVSDGLEQEVEPDTVAPTTITTTTTTTTTPSTTTLQTSRNFDIAFTNASEVSSGAGGCMFGDKYYHEGAQMPSDPSKPCEVCYCIRNHSACVMQDCALEVGGCTPIYQSGGCCPSRYNCSSVNAFTTPRPQANLPESSTRRRFWESHSAGNSLLSSSSTTTVQSIINYSTTTAKPIAFPDFGRTPIMPPPGCKAHNSSRLYADGERVPSKNKCEHCYCMRSEIVCAVQECRPPCDGCVPIIDANDQCCPKRYECAAPIQRVPTDNVIDVQDTTTASQPVTPSYDLTKENAPANLSDISTTQTSIKNSESSSTPSDEINVIGYNVSAFTVVPESSKPESSVMTTRQTKPPLKPISPKLSLNEEDSANEMVHEQDLAKSTKADSSNVDGFNLHGEREQEDSPKTNSRFVAPEGSQPVATNPFSESSEASVSSLTSTVAPPMSRDNANPTNFVQTEATPASTSFAEATSSGDNLKKSRPSVVSSSIPGEGSCRYNGRMYQNGQEVKSKDNCMEICMCINSVVYCDEVDCPKGPKDQDKCQRIVVEGECCPKYICDDKEVMITTAPTTIVDTSSSSSEGTIQVDNGSSSIAPTTIGSEQPPKEVSSTTEAESQTPTAGSEVSITTESSFTVSKPSPDQNLTPSDSSSTTATSESARPTTFSETNKTIDTTTETPTTINVDQSSSIASTTLVPDRSSTLSSDSTSSHTETPKLTTDSQDTRITDTTSETLTTARIELSSIAATTLAPEPSSTAAAAEISSSDQTGPSSSSTFGQDVKANDVTTEASATTPRIDLTSIAPTTMISEQPPMELDASLNKASEPAATTTVTQTTKLFETTLSPQTRPSDAVGITEPSGMTTVDLNIKAVDSTNEIPSNPQVDSSSQSIVPTTEPSEQLFESRSTENESQSQTTVSLSAKPNDATTEENAPPTPKQHSTSTETPTIELVESSSPTTVTQSTTTVATTSEIPPTNPSLVPASVALGSFSSNEVEPSKSTTVTSETKAVEVASEVPTTIRVDSSSVAATTLSPKQTTTTFGISNRSETESPSSSTATQDVKAINVASEEPTTPQVDLSTIPTTPSDSKSGKGPESFSIDSGPNWPMAPIPEQPSSTVDSSMNREVESPNQATVEKQSNKVADGSNEIPPNSDIVSSSPPPETSDTKISDDKYKESSSPATETPSIKAIDVTSEVPLVTKVVSSSTMLPTSEQISTLADNLSTKEATESTRPTIVIGDIKNINTGNEIPVSIKVESSSIAPTTLISEQTSTVGSSSLSIEAEFSQSTTVSQDTKTTEATSEAPATIRIDSSSTVPPSIEQPSVTSSSLSLQEGKPLSPDTAAPSNKVSIDVLENGNTYSRPSQPTTFNSFVEDLATEKVESSTPVTIAHETKSFDTTTIASTTSPIESSSIEPTKLTSERPPMTVDGASSREDDSAISTAISQGNNTAEITTNSPTILGAGSTPLATISPEQVSSAEEAKTPDSITSTESTRTDMVTEVTPNLRVDPSSTLLPQVNREQTSTENGISRENIDLSKQTLIPETTQIFIGTTEVPTTISHNLSTLAATTAELEETSTSSEILVSDGDESLKPTTLYQDINVIDTTKEISTSSRVDSTTNAPTSLPPEQPSDTISGSTFREASSPTLPTITQKTNIIDATTEVPLDARVELSSTVSTESSPELTSASLDNLSVKESESQGPVAFTQATNAIDAASKALTPSQTTVQPSVVDDSFSNKDFKPLSPTVTESNKASDLVTNAPLNTNIDLVTPPTPSYAPPISIIDDLSIKEAGSPSPTTVTQVFKANSETVEIPQTTSSLGAFSMVLENATSEKAAPPIMTTITEANKTIDTTTETPTTINVDQSSSIASTTLVPDRSSTLSSDSTSSHTETPKLTTDSQDTRITDTTSETLTTARIELSSIAATTLAPEPSSTTAAAEISSSDQTGATSTSLVLQDNRASGTTIEQNASTSVDQNLILPTAIAPEQTPVIADGSLNKEAQPGISSLATEGSKINVAVSEATVTVRPDSSPLAETTPSPELPSISTESTNSREAESSPALVTQQTKASDIIGAISQSTLGSGPSVTVESSQYPSPSTVNEDTKSVDGSNEIQPNSRVDSNADSSVPKTPVAVEPSNFAEKSNGKESSPPSSTTVTQSIKQSNMGNEIPANLRLDSTFIPPTTESLQQPSVIVDESSNMLEGPVRPTTITDSIKSTPILAETTTTLPIDTSSVASTTLSPEQPTESVSSKETEAPTTKSVDSTTEILTTLGVDSSSIAPVLSNSGQTSVVSEDVVIEKAASPILTTVTASIKNIDTTTEIPAIISVESSPMTSTTSVSEQLPSVDSSSSEPEAPRPTSVSPDLRVIDVTSGAPTTPRIDLNSIANTISNQVQPSTTNRIIISGQAVPENTSTVLQDTKPNDATTEENAPPTPKQHSTSTETPTIELVESSSPTTVTQSTTTVATTSEIPPTNPSLVPASVALGSFSSNEVEPSKSTTVTSETKAVEVASEVPTTIRVDSSSVAATTLSPKQTTTTFGISNRSETESPSSSTATQDVKTIVATSEVPLATINQTQTSGVFESSESPSPTTTTLNTKLLEVTSEILTTVRLDSSSLAATIPSTEQYQTSTEISSAKELESSPTTVSVVTEATSTFSASTSADSNLITSTSTKSMQPSVIDEGSSSKKIEFASPVTPIQDSKLSEVTTEAPTTLRFDLSSISGTSIQLEPSSTPTETSNKKEGELSNLTTITQDTKALDAATEASTTLRADISSTSTTTIGPEQQQTSTDGSSSSESPGTATVTLGSKAIDVTTVPSLSVSSVTTSPADEFAAGVMTTKSTYFKPIDVTTVIPSIRGSPASITIPWSDISSNITTTEPQVTNLPPIVSSATNYSSHETKSPAQEPTQSSPAEPDYEEISEESGCEYEGKTYNSAQQIPRSNPCDFCFCFRGDIICLQQTCPPPVPHCFETIMDGFCCPRYECPVHTVRSTSNSTSLSLTPYDTHSRLHAHTHDIGRPQSNKGSNVRGCFVDNKLYGVGQVIESASSPCLECKCDKSGMMRCNPKECTPEDPLLQQINREVLQSTLSRSQVR